MRADINRGFCVNGIVLLGTSSLFKCWAQEKAESPRYFQYNYRSYPDLDLLRQNRSDNLILAIQSDFF